MTGDRQITNVPVLGVEPTPDAAEGFVRLRTDLIALPLDEDTVVFSDAAQRLVGLNPTAAFVFRKLEQGWQATDIEAAVVGAGLASVEDGKRWVVTTIEALAAHGMLEDGRATRDALSVSTAGPGVPTEPITLAEVPPYRPFTPIAERPYRLLETSVSIRASHTAQLRLVDFVIGHLATEGDVRPDVTIDIQGVLQDDSHLASHIYRDGIAIGHARRLSRLGPIVKSAVWQSAVNAHDFLFYIHAGVVGADGTCVILPAAAGSGKSTLTFALTCAGYRYYSDEVALIERSTFLVPPVPLAICAKKTGWRLMERYYPGVWDLPLHGREDLKWVRYIPPPIGAAGRPPQPVSHIIFPRYVADSETRLTSVAPSSALGRLMTECLALRGRLNQDNVAALVRWLSAIHCYDLVFSDLDEAVDAIKATVPPMR